MDVGECLGRRAPHYYDTAFVPRKNGFCSEMGNLRRAAKNHQHTVLADASVASVAEMSAALTRLRHADGP